MTKTLWLAQWSSCCGVCLCLVFLCLDLVNLDIFESIVAQLDVQVWWWFDDAKVLRKYKFGDDCLSVGLCGRKDPQAFKNDGCGSFGRNTLASCLIGNIKCVFVCLCICIVNTTGVAALTTTQSQSLSVRVYKVWHGKCDVWVSWVSWDAGVMKVKITFTSFCDHRPLRWPENSCPVVLCGVGPLLGCLDNMCACCKRHYNSWNISDML